LHNLFPNQADLHIYTLGNETIAPFRLNPFAFETDDHPEHSLLRIHTDLLKTVFQASFSFQSTTLETALHEIYEDKGWDFVSGLNTRLPDWSKRELYPIFPTLSDFYAKLSARPHTTLKNPIGRYWQSRLMLCC
jgi:hypothetical protein